MEIVSVRKFEGAMKAKRKVLSNLNNCSPEQKSVAKKAKRILLFNITLNFYHKSGAMKAKRRAEDSFMLRGNLYKLNYKLN